MSSAMNVFLLGLGQKFMAGKLLALYASSTPKKSEL